MLDDDPAAVRIPLVQNDLTDDASVDHAVASGAEADFSSFARIHYRFEHMPHVERGKHLLPRNLTFFLDEFKYFGRRKQIVFAVGDARRAEVFDLGLAASRAVNEPHDMLMAYAFDEKANEWRIGAGRRKKLSYEYGRKPIQTKLAAVYKIDRSFRRVGFCVDSKCSPKH